MFQITRKSIGSAVAAAALAASLLAPAAFAAEPEVQVQVQSAGSYTAPRVLSHTADGWVLDAGGPSIYFERIDE